MRFLDHEVEILVLLSVVVGSLMALGFHGGVTEDSFGPLLTGVTTLLWAIPVSKGLLDELKNARNRKAA